VLVADHGMAATPIERWILVDRILPPEQIDVVWSGATLGFNPKPGAEQRVERALRKLPPAMQCWHKEKIPAHLKFGTHPRVPRIVCLARTGWLFRTGHDLATMKNPANGQHGYDPADPLMAALFVARGPHFTPGVVLPPFDNVDVYPLLMRLLDLKPEPNDGRIEPLLPALRN
jgi:predicted AlkP superfamily pyrophosphatase or phosphodiesterase